MNKLAIFFRESRVGRFFIPLGIILIVFSVFLFIITEHNKDYIKVEATVSKANLAQEATIDSEGNHVDATYNIYVKYTVDGKNYDELLGELSGYKEGDKITIVYNPNNPKEISQPSSIFLAIGVLVAGIGALVYGIISSINSIKKYKELKKQEEGWKNNE